MKIKNIINEFAPANNPGGGNYLKALASAWYNGTFNTGDLHKGIKSQEDVERILERGIHCGDGKVRKYSIGYNSDFDGVEIQSDDHYEYSDYDDAGREIDSRTGKPWGPYDVVAFGGNELDESVAKGSLNEFAPGGNSASSYYAVTANFVNEFAQQKQEEIQDLIDAGWTKQDLAQAGTQEAAAADIAHLEQVRDGFLKGLKPGFDAYLQGDTQLKDQLGASWIDNDLPLNQDWEKIYGEPWGDDGEFDEGVAEGSLNEFSLDGDDDDDTPKDDPYKYPKPEQYRRSIDFFGKFEANHFDKEDMDDATGVFKGYWYYGNKLKQIAYFKFDNPQRTGSNDPGMGWYYEPQDDEVAEATGDEKFDKIMRKATGNITPADAAGYWPTREYEPIDLDPSYLPSMAKYKAQLYPLAYNWWSDGGDGTEEAQLRKLGWEPSYGDDYVMVVLSGIGHDGHIQYDIRDFDVDDEDLDEGKPEKPKQPEADYGNEYQAMVKRMKQLAGLGPLRTVYDPNKRVYKNVPAATQPGAKK